MKRFVFFGITWALVMSVPRHKQASDESHGKDLDALKEVFKDFRQFPEKGFQILQKNVPREVLENSREFPEQSSQILKKNVPKGAMQNSREFPEKTLQTLKKNLPKKESEDFREFGQNNFQISEENPRKEVFGNSREFQKTNLWGLENHVPKGALENSREFPEKTFQTLKKNLPKKESEDFREIGQNNFQISEEGVLEEILLCERGQPACACTTPHIPCRLNLEIDEIQTFTSYQKIFWDEPTGVAMRGTKGVIYYLGENGTALPLRQNTPCSTLNNTNCTNPQFVDGKTYRLAIAVNGQIPGPTLIAHEGQTVKIHVKNNLTSEGISIHWHGMHQRGTPWMDGVGQVTQCPIDPQSSFLYEYNATPPGTFWYHSHSGAQRTDGLFGALIVKEKYETMEKIYTALHEHGVCEGTTFQDLPDQHTLTLLDWQQEASLDLFTQIHASLGFYPDTLNGDVPQGKKYNPTESFEGADIGPVPYFSGLINGKGRHADVPYNKTRLSIFTVEHGKTYRFRLIGAQGLYAYRFSIDGHKLTVVGTDGYWLEPVKEVDYIIVHTGERYDFLLNATDTNEVNDYWMRAETLESNTSKSEPPPYRSLGHVAEAILHYKQSGESDDQDVNVPSTRYQDIKDNSPPIQCTKDAKCRAVNCPFKEFHASYNITCVNVHDLRLLMPTPPDELPNANPKDPEKCPNCTHFINFNFEGDSDSSSVNGRNFLLPSFNPQMQRDLFEERDIKCNPTVDCNPSTLDCSCVHVIEIPENETVQLVLSALGFYNSTHPIHLHGHTFHVVHVEYPKYDNKTGLIENHTSNIHCNDTNCTKKGCKPNRCTRPSWAETFKPDFSINNKTVRKDTVMVPAGGYVVINFISDNPGWWFLHCHIEIHQLEGMALIVNELPGKPSGQHPRMPGCGKT